MQGAGERAPHDVDGRDAAGPRRERGRPLVQQHRLAGDGREPAPLIIAWHLNDPPRSAAAMASALPLAGVAAWRVYLDLPMHGRRQLSGGLEEFMRLGY